jgi:hypothetical protein
MDSADTELSFEDNQNGFDKKFIKKTDFISEKLRINDSPNKNSISAILNPKPIKSLYEF